MNLQLDATATRRHEAHHNLWADNRVWWVNCLAVERFWIYGGADLQVARGRRDAMLSSLLLNL